MGRPGWAAWGGSSRRAPQSPGGQGEQLEGCREGPRRVAVPPPHPFPSQRPLPTGLPTGLALPLLPLPSITPCQPLPAPPLHCPLFCSHPLPSPFSIPLPHSLLSSPLQSSLFSESFSLASFLSSSWVKNNQLSGKQQPLLSRPPHTWEPLRIAFRGSQLQPLLSPTAPSPRAD